MTYTQKFDVQPVAIRVKGIHWHIRFFCEAQGMDVREIDGTPPSPRALGALALCALV